LRGLDATELSDHRADVVDVSTLAEQEDQLP
jgi:hypothetical protein